MKTPTRKIIAHRISLLKAYHQIICLLNDETAYMTWIYLMPDNPDEEDFEIVAEDEELFKDAVKTFHSIYTEHSLSGIFDGRKVWWVE